MRKILSSEVVRNKHTGAPMFIFRRYGPDLIMEKEYCSECDEETGKAGRGEDSLFIEMGPLCETCYDEIKDY